MRIVVLGGDGMLGHRMFLQLRERFGDVRCTLLGRLADSPLPRVATVTPAEVVEAVNVMDEAQLRDVLEAIRPDAVVNCVGIIKQRPAGHDALLSIAINALLPHRLAHWAAGWGGRVVHFSTDCVFDGRRGRYTEDDLTNAEDLYGRTKALGELAVDNALTLRTSIIGRELSHHRSLLDWFLQQRGRRISGYTRVIYSGVTTIHLATLVGDLLERPSWLHGRYQVASTPISKHDLLVLLREAYRLDVEIDPDDREVSDRSMLATRFAAATGYVCPTWPELVAELAGDRVPYPPFAPV